MLALIAFLLHREDKQGITFKEGAIKCFKERKITAPPNDWCNMPLFSRRLQHSMRVVALCNKLSRSKLKGDEVESPKIGHRPIVSNMTTGTQIQVSHFWSKGCIQQLVSLLKQQRKFLPAFGYSPIQTSPFCVFECFCKM